MWGQAWCLAGAPSPYLGTLLETEPAGRQQQPSQQRAPGRGLCGLGKASGEARSEVSNTQKTRRRERAVLDLTLGKAWSWLQRVRFRLNFRKIAVGAAVKHQNGLMSVAVELLPLNLGTEEDEDGLARVAGLCLGGLTRSRFPRLLSPLGDKGQLFLLPNTQLVMLEVFSLPGDHTNLTFLLCNRFVSVTKIRGFKCKAPASENCQPGEV